MLYEEIVGIDLGTTNSVVGAWKKGVGVDILKKHSTGQALTPSFVSYTPKEVSSGQAGKDKHISNPENTLYDMKRLFGKPWSHSDIQKNRKFWTFNLVEDQKCPVALVRQGNKQLKVRPEKSPL